MTEDIVEAGSQYVTEAKKHGKNLTEKSLRMHCLAYQHQIKSKLLMEAIVDINSSKRELATLKAEMERQKYIISEQNLRLSEINRSLISDRDALELKIEERINAYEKLANYDSLTSLPNRFLFKDRLNHAMARAHRGKYKVAVLLIDIDRFKNINDTAGHPAGDAILTSAALRLQRAVRADDTVARLGGDEFAIILEALDASNLAESVTELIQQAMALPFTVNDETIYLTFSTGISIYPDHATSAVALLKNADVAMYRAKTLGKNRYQFYNGELAVAAHSRFSLEAQLQQALIKHEFQIHYQPLVNMETRKVEGAEALIRWIHPERGLIMPGDFIWLAEETGFILEIGEWVLRETCLQIKKWMESGVITRRVSVNLSALQFAQPDILERVKSILAETGCSANFLEVEITESVLVAQPEAMCKIVDSFKAEGITVAIDDFGTGYSSLAYLKRFQPDQLKIDRSFVCNVIANTDDIAIIRAIISLGHALGLSLVAEGVETEEQAEFLKSEGCDLAQGFLYGKPVPANEFPG
ncbi:MAG: EAL domain-containing protein [Gammaproteobacteria bacterium]|nr:EAL domain-containing protein [Gammaproteobacteria bacterium]